MQNTQYIDGFSNEKRILVVDDEPSIRNVMEAIISDLGYKVDTARHGDEAYSKYKERQGHNQYRLILTDRDMNPVGGIELMSRIVDSGNGVPVVLMSGNYVKEQEWKSVGFKSFLPKPFGIMDIEACVAKYAGSRSQ